MDGLVFVCIGVDGRMSKLIVGVIRDLVLK